MILFSFTWASSRETQAPKNQTKNNQENFLFGGGGQQKTKFPFGNFENQGEGLHIWEISDLKNFLRQYPKKKHNILICLIQCKYAFLNVTLRESAASKKNSRFFLAILDYQSLYWSIFEYCGLYTAILGYISLSLAVSGYLWQSMDISGFNMLIYSYFETFSLFYLFFHFQQK